MKNKFYSPEMIDYELGTGREMIPEYARRPLANSLALLPRKVIDFAIENLVFITVEKEDGGMYVSLNNQFLKGKKGFILIPWSTWSGKQIEIAFTIAHEVAHSLKGHELKSFDDMKIEKCSEWEKEADRLAVRWLSKHYKREHLMKLCCSEYGKSEARLKH